MVHLTHLRILLMVRCWFHFLWRWALEITAFESIALLLEHNIAGYVWTHVLFFIKETHPGKKEHTQKVLHVQGRRTSKKEHTQKVLELRGKAPQQKGARSESAAFAKKQHVSKKEHTWKVQCLQEGHPNTNDDTQKVLRSKGNTNPTRNKIANMRCMDY